MRALCVRAPGARVVLVGTHLDACAGGVGSGAPASEVQRAVFEDGWAGGLGSLHGPARAADVRMVSSTAPLAGVDELRAHILATLRDAAAFPGVRAPVPS